MPVGAQAPDWSCTGQQRTNARRLEAWGSVVYWSSPKGCFSSALGTPGSQGLG